MGGMVKIVEATKARSTFSELLNNVRYGLIAC